eukprot:CAMPEP_0180623206 /NCGR_PEP_ID=MMETSP1037_2-20121125/36100_1 /TAXON_ID=632150 /ORGANISM="Azadinium spinosum, Strain 3D9" /LENGTH=198 /DNA_ID=CAMNT_0022643517 /DNA_START=59 /DNA_END=656 /DNA_ORIENTATION=-
MRPVMSDGSGRDTYVILDTSIRDGHAPATRAKWIPSLRKASPLESLGHSRSRETWYVQSQSATRSSGSLQSGAAARESSAPAAPGSTGPRNAWVAELERSPSEKALKRMLLRTASSLKQRTSAPLGIFKSAMYNGPPAGTLPIVLRGARAPPASALDGMLATPADAPDALVAAWPEALGYLAHPPSLLDVDIAGVSGI